MEICIRSLSTGYYSYIQTARQHENGVKFSYIPNKESLENMCGYFSAGWNMKNKKKFRKIISPEINFKSCISPKYKSSRDCRTLPTNISTWARKPPRAGPMINPIPQAVLIWNYKLNVVHAMTGNYKFHLSNRVWNNLYNLLLTFLNHDTLPGKFQQHMPDQETLHLIVMKLSQVLITIRGV